MNKRFFLSIFIILLYSSIWSQNITFEKLDLFDNAFLSSIYQSSDGSYYYAGPQGIAHADSFGTIQWYNAIDDANSLVPIQAAFESPNILVPSAYDNNGENNLLVTLFDMSGKVVEKRKIENPGYEEIGYAATSLNGSYYVVSHINNDSLRVYKFDSSLELTWTNTIALSYFSFLKKIGIVKDSNYLYLWGALSIFKIDLDGNILDTISTSKRIYNLQIKNSTYYVNYGSQIDVIDSSGNSTKIITLPTTSVKSLLLDTGEFIIASRSKIYKIQQDEIVVWESTTRMLSNFADICRCQDGGFSSIGQYTENGNWRIKVDSLGEFKYIDQILPNRSEGINREYQVNWETNISSMYSLELSTDNGKSWHLIGYADEGKTSKLFYLPLVNYDSCRIKLSSITYPEIFDITVPFQIRISQDYDYIAANDVLMWVGNNGDGSHDPRSDGSGFYWPGGEEATLSSIFEDGLVWGGKINGEVRLNGNTHRQGIRPGIIMENGLPSDPKDSKYKIYKIKKGWESLPAGIEKENYQYNYENWPMDIGAPYNDVDNNGTFTPGTDTPQFVGDETLFFVSNDLDSATSLSTYGSPPIGLEIQTTVWAFDRQGSPYKDVVFKKYKIINKSENLIEDMYFTYFTDDDLGNASDDFTGCDTLLNLGYTYNGDIDDDDFYNYQPPAVGHMFVQTPVVESDADSAFFNNRWISGFKNLSMNSFILFWNVDMKFKDPSIGVYEGSLEFYNYQTGLFWDGSHILDPNTDKETSFSIPGDPVEKMGWYEGDGWPGGPEPGDRRYIMTTGKFNMASGDTQEVVVAIFMAQGSNNLNSVTKLKEAAIDLQYFYNGKVLTDIKENETQPLKYSLSQNYPNPFNPSTKIKFSIANDDRVNISIFNILGERVAVLTDQVYKAGSHEIQFNASQLSSGVYFYQMKSGDFVNVKKLMLLK